MHPPGTPAASPTSVPTVREGSNRAGRAPGARIAALDGVRAVAAALVVVHHAAAVAGTARAGWIATPAATADIGVAVFFVLSGFVVWRPFAVAHATGADLPETRRFILRRLVRVYPAYWAAFLFFWIAGTVQVHSVAGLVGHLTLLHVVAPGTVFAGIVPAWSLAVEVTFYLLVPVASAWLRRGRAGVSEGREWALIAGVVVLANLWRLAISASPWHWGGTRVGALAFVWFPTHMDLLAAGMAVAVLWARRGPGVGAEVRVARHVTAWWLCAAGILLAYSYLVGGVAFNEGYSFGHLEVRQLAYGAVGVLLVAPLALTVRPSLVAGAMASRPLVWLGGISYGLYLWHHDWIEVVARELTRPVPGTSFARFGTGPGDASFALLLAAGLGLGLLFGYASKLVVEDPLNAWAHRVGRRKVPS